MNKYPQSNREQLLTILKYYLNTSDTDITNFSHNLTEKLREYTFTFQPNPTTALDLDETSIKCSIVLDRDIGVYYIGIGTYKEVISEYDYKTLKENYFARKFLYENYRKSDPVVDKLVQYTYDSMLKTKQSIGRNLHHEPMGDLVEAAPMEMGHDEVLTEESTDAIRDIVAERKDLPYDAMGTYDGPNDGPNEDRG